MTIGVGRIRDEIRALCRKIYQQRIADPALNIPNELRRSLAAHERVPVFIDRLAEELSGLHFSAKRETIEQAVRDMTDFFISSIKHVADVRAMSDMEKLLIKQKADEKKEIEQLADELEKVGVNNVIQDNGKTTDKSVNEISERILSG